jgi:hypothetical protein
MSGRQHCDRQLLAARHPCWEPALQRIATEVLGFAIVVQTTASIAAVGGSRLRLRISFEAEPRPGGCRLVTETRVAASVPRALLAFRAY